MITIKMFLDFVLNYYPIKVRIIRERSQVAPLSILLLKNLVIKKTKKLYLSFKINIFHDILLICFASFLLVDEFVSD